MIQHNNSQENLGQYLICKFVALTLIWVSLAIDEVCSNEGLYYTPVDLLFKTEFQVVCLKEFSKHVDVSIIGSE